MPERNEEILTPVLTPVGAAEPGRAATRGRGWGAASALSLIMHASMAAALFLVVQAPPELKIAKGDEPMQVSFIQLPKPVPERPRRPHTARAAAAATRTAATGAAQARGTAETGGAAQAGGGKAQTQAEAQAGRAQPAEAAAEKGRARAGAVAQAAPTPAPAPAATAAPSQPAPAAAPSGPPKTAGLPTGSIDDADIRPIKMTPEYPKCCVVAVWVARCG